MSPEGFMAERQIQNAMVKKSGMQLALLPLFFLLRGAFCSEDEHRLHDELFVNYNNIIRPVENASDPVIVWFEVSLSQLVKVDEVNQIMETNLWLKHIWNDYKLRWNPDKYGGVQYIRVPSNKIWKPDIMLYNKTPRTHTMPEWVKIVFLNFLPRIMFMTRPTSNEDEGRSQKVKPSYNTELSQLNFIHIPDSRCCQDCFPCQGFTHACCQHEHKKHLKGTSNLTQSSSSESMDALFSSSFISPEVRDVMDSIKYIAENMKLQNEAKETQDDWKYVAMVIDRIFLWVFILVCILGTAGLFLQPLMIRDEV